MKRKCPFLFFVVTVSFGILQFFMITYKETTLQEIPDENIDKWVVVVSETIDSGIWACSSNWNAIIVPKESIANRSEDRPNCHILTRQRALLELSWKTNSWKSINERRNVGFLFALQKRAELIFDAGEESVKPIPLISEHNSVENFYAHHLILNPLRIIFDIRHWQIGFPAFGGSQKPTSSDLTSLWTPLHSLNYQENLSIEPLSMKLLGPVPHLKALRKDPFAIGNGTMIPVEDKILVYSSMAMLLWCPSSPSEELGTILRGYIAQKILFGINTSVVIHPIPSNQQIQQIKPTESVLSKSLSQTMQLTFALNFLSSLELGTFSNIGDAFLKIYSSMTKVGILTQSDFKRAELWVLQLRDMGFDLKTTVKIRKSEFPPLDNVPMDACQILWPCCTRPKPIVSDIQIAKQQAKTLLSTKTSKESQNICPPRYPPTKPNSITDSNHPTICIGVQIATSQELLQEFTLSEGSALTEKYEKQIMDQLDFDVPEFVDELFFGVSEGDPLATKWLQPYLQQRFGSFSIEVFPPEMGDACRWTHLAKKSFTEKCDFFVQIHNIKTKLTELKIPEMINELNQCRQSTGLDGPTSGLGIVCLHFQREACVSMIVPRSHFLIFDSLVSTLSKDIDWAAQAYGFLGFPGMTAANRSSEKQEHQKLELEIAKIEIIKRAPKFMCKRTLTEDVLERNLHILSSKLLSQNISFFLFYGSLLGLQRDGRLIDGDDDVDIFVEKVHFSRVAQMFNTTRYIKNDVFLQANIEETVADIYFYNTQDTVIEDWWNFSGGQELLLIPKDLIFPLKSQQLNSIVVQVPSKPEETLEYLYGFRWKEKLKKKVDYSIAIKNRKPQIIYMK